MYAGKVELCGVDTARLPVLSEAEKSRLIKAARAGDRHCLLYTSDAADD